MVLPAAFLGLVFLWSLVSRRLERTILTAPILFAAGGAIGKLAVPEAGRAGDLGLFLSVAEIGLVLLLFTDASRTDLRVLRGIRRLPARLLSVGLLLTIVLGAAAAKLLFPSLSLSEAGILAAILAPTDAGLGQVIVTSPRVPERIRQALNVEAGLNDGLSVPFFLFFLALAAPHAEGDASLARFVVEQLGYGAALGAAVGYAGGALLGLARRRGWASGAGQQLGTVVLPLFLVLVSEEIGASMFIAAFVGGLFVQVSFHEARSHAGEFGEHLGQLLNDAVFFLFGMLFVGASAHLTAAMAVYAVLSLTVVRIVPVAIALLGSGVSRATVAFVGWFGPRGLASIVLGLVFLERGTRVPGEETIRLAVIATVFLSVLAHGASAMPGISLYERSIGRLPAGAPERRGEVG